MGTIALNKRLLLHDVWQREPFSAGQAWVDLILRANDAPRTATINGESIPLKRGQLAWSIRRLEKEWQRSGEWVKAFLLYCQNESMIRCQTTKRGTIITVLNYEAYNPVRAVTDSETEPDSVSDSETVTDSETEPERKGEQGRGIRNQESGIPPSDDDFAEIPDQAEVLAFAEAFTGDLVRGIPAVIPERWAVDWFAWRETAGSWPKKWRTIFVRDFTRDFEARHPKAVGGSVKTKKNGGAVQMDGRTPAQRRYELTRELEEVRARLDAAHDTAMPPSAKDKGREKELSASLKATADL